MWLPVPSLSGLPRDERAISTADETVRTEVTLTANRVTTVALDFLPIDSRTLPMPARMVKAMMRRSGVLALLPVA
jgi:hypothetical protein